MRKKLAQSDSFSLGENVMKVASIGLLLASALTSASGSAVAADGQASVVAPPPYGRVQISTVPLDPGLVLRTATYTPGGKILVSYATKDDGAAGPVRLATMDDDGKNFRPFLSQRLPVRAKDNGVRFMVFSDNRRIFLGDSIIECPTNLETCERPSLYTVTYPAEVADGHHVSHRWSEIIVAPDNRHIAWTTLLANYSAVVFVGELEKEDARYRIINPRIVSTLDPFQKDPKHADGVIPGSIRGGEVKQFVHGGSAISMVGAITRDTPDSLVQHLASGKLEAITDTPGYTETTIFSPDERLGVTMTTRFSPQSDPAILGLMPRPYPASLNMGLSMFAYTYAVTGVRLSRPGNVGPALIDIQASKSHENYLGTNLSTQADWVFSSPISWHPSSKKAMWIELTRGREKARIQIASLPDYRPGPAPQAQATPSRIPYGSSDLSVVPRYARSAQDIHVKVYGRKSGYVQYQRTPEGVSDKTYVNFSDDGKQVYSGRETMRANPGGQSTYTADVTLSGPKPGAMKLKITFGPLGGKAPARIVFDKDQAGTPLSRGYVEYRGRRLDVATLVP